MTTAAISWTFAITALGGAVGNWLGALGPRLQSGFRAAFRIPSTWLADKWRRLRTPLTDRAETAKTMSARTGPNRFGAETRIPLTSPSSTGVKANKPDTTQITIKTPPRPAQIRPLSGKVTNLYSPTTRRSGSAKASFDVMRDPEAAIVGGGFSKTEPPVMRGMYTSLVIQRKSSSSKNSGMSSQQRTVCHFSGGRICSELHSDSPGPASESCMTTTRPAKWCSSFRSRRSAFTCEYEACLSSTAQLMRCQVEDSNQYPRATHPKSPPPAQRTAPRTSARKPHRRPK